jgi:hypothetical protein
MAVISPFRLSDSRPAETIPVFLAGRLSARRLPEGAKM